MSESPSPQWATDGERALALLAMLRPLMGNGSTGTITAYANAGKYPVVYQHQFMFPLLTGSDGTSTQVDWTAPFRVTATTSVTPAGTVIPIASSLGGSRQNLAPGTKMVWFPNPGDVASQATVISVAGADTLDDPGALKTVVWYEEPAAGDMPDDLLRACLAGTPAAILSWNGSSAYKMRGDGLQEQDDKWTWTIVSARSDSHHLRGYQGLLIAGLIAAMIGDRGSSDDALVSGMPINLMGRRRVAAQPGYYAYAVDFVTRNSVLSLAKSNPELLTQSPQANAWIISRISMPTPQDETLAHPTALDVLKGK